MEDEVAFPSFIEIPNLNVGLMVSSPNSMQLTIVDSLRRNEALFVYAIAKRRSLPVFQCSRKCKTENPHHCVLKRRIAQWPR